MGRYRGSADPSCFRTIVLLAARASACFSDPIVAEHGHHQNGSKVCLLRLMGNLRIVGGDVSQSSALAKILQKVIDINLTYPRIWRCVHVKGLTDGIQPVFCSCKLEEITLKWLSPLVHDCRSAPNTSEMQKVHQTASITAYLVIELHASFASKTITLWWA